MAQNKIIKSGKKRKGVYIGGIALTAAIVLATLVTLGKLSKDDIEAWMVLVAALSTSIVNWITNLLAAVNTDRDDAPVGNATGEHLSFSAGDELD